MEISAWTRKGIVQSLDYHLRYTELKLANKLLQQTDISVISDFNIPLIKSNI